VDHVRWHTRPDLTNPIVVAAFTGWNDAGDAASTTVRQLIERWGAAPLLSIDPEEFTDFATVRPHVRLRDGHTREIVWPQVSAWWTSGPAGDVVLVLGPEPSLRWRLFCDQLVAVAIELDCPLFVTLGSLLADVPHTRETNVIGTASDDDLIERFDLVRSQYEGPTGIVGVLHDALQRGGIPSASLWAAVPAYAAQFPSPKATAALLARLAVLLGAPMPIQGLQADIAAYERQVDEALEDDDDMRAYVARLELMADTDDDGDDEDDDVSDDDARGPEAGTLDADGAPQLIEELERFLRDQEG
jgi:proteasome assembly chaperone (PAC2) family protein